MIKLIRLAMSSIIFFITLAGCASNDHLLFFTNSTIGVEIGSDVTAGTPVKFIVGYKRQEGVIDPLIPKYTFTAGANSGITKPEDGNTAIILTPNGTAIPDGSVTQPHSVLAKINFGANATSSQGATASQWFATGRAAELVAQAPTVAGALTGDASNNSTQRVVLSDANGSVAVLAHLEGVYRLLANSISDGNAPPGAYDVMKNVDKLDDGEFKKNFTLYTWSQGNAGKDVDISTFTPQTTHLFKNIPEYIANLSSSADVASTTLATSSITITGSAASDAQRKAMLADIQDQKARQTSVAKVVSENKDVIAMIDFVYTKVLLTKPSPNSGGK